MVLGEEIAKRRPDFEYLGQDKVIDLNQLDKNKIEVAQEKIEKAGGKAELV